MSRVSTAHAAEIAGVKEGNVRVWISRGKLTRYKDGIDVAELLAWLDDVRDPYYYALAKKKAEKSTQTT